MVGGSRPRKVSLREAATWSLVWVAMSFLFAAALWWQLDGSAGREVANRKSLEFVTGYAIEKSLAIDNVFDWKNGVRYATPLLPALILVEISDLIFAVDSIPAIFTITADPFIVLTSNVFAILGLRAMYFLQAGMADRLSLVKYGRAAVLVFSGVKMLLIDLYQIPIGFSLAVVATFIGISVWLWARKEKLERAAAGIGKA